MYAQQRNPSDALHPGHHITLYRKENAQRDKMVKVIGPTKLTLTLAAVQLSRRNFLTLNEANFAIKFQMKVLFVLEMSKFQHDARQASMSKTSLNCSTISTQYRLVKERKMDGHTDMTIYRASRIQSNAQKTANKKHQPKSVTSC